MALTNRKAGIALFAIAATMKAFGVSSKKACSDKYLAFRTGQIKKHNLEDHEVAELLTLDPEILVSFKEGSHD